VFALSQTAGGAAGISIADSILWGPGMLAFDRRAYGGNASVSVTTSDFPYSWQHFNERGARGAFDLDSTNANADPGFVGGGDFHLRPDSLLVDLGTRGPGGYAPDEPATDLAGNRRIVDGDNDAAARRDMGAFEVNARPNRVIKTGTGARNVLRGTRRDDALYGRAGKDLLLGGAGNDWLYGGRGRDRMFGEGGDDELFGADGSADLLACGTGRDIAFVDGSDTVRACETVIMLPFRFAPVPMRTPSAPPPGLPPLSPLEAPAITPPFSPSLSIKKEADKKDYTITGSGWDRCQNDVVLTNVTRDKAIGTPDPDTSGNFSITSDDVKKDDVVRGEELLCDGLGDKITAEATAP
jgi:hemolysin type calcium-binding protein